MGKRGPRPEPRALQIAKDTWRGKKRPAEPDEVAGSMVMPDWLGPIGVLKWNEMMPVLFGRGTVSPAYSDFLAMYCQSHQDLHDAMATLEAEGEYVHSEKGGVYQHPAMGKKTKAIDRIAKFGREFGFSPTSVRDIQVTPRKEKAADKKKRFFAG